MKIIVLAAGLSRRMGEQNKLLLPYKGSTILGITLKNIIDADLGEVVLVVGYQKDIILDFINKNFKENIIQIVENQYFEQGMTTSIQAGLMANELKNTEGSSIANSIRNRSEGVPMGKPKIRNQEGYMICLSDMPLIQPSEYTFLKNEFLKIKTQNPKAIIQPNYKGQRGNPTIFSDFYKNEILNLTYTEGCKPIVQAHQNNLYLVDMPTDSILKDADTPEAYALLLKQ